MARTVVISASVKLVMHGSVASASAPSFSETSTTFVSSYAVTPWIVVRASMPSQQATTLPVSAICSPSKASSQGRQCGFVYSGGVAKSLSQVTRVGEPFTSCKISKVAAFGPNS